MTIEELVFRQSDLRRAELRVILNDETFKLATAAVLAKFFGKEADLKSPEITSVRLLSLRAGYESCLADLAELTEVPTPEPKQPQPDYGHPDEAARLAEFGELPPAYTGPQ